MRSSNHQMPAWAGLPPDAYACCQVGRSGSVISVSADSTRYDDKKSARTTSHPGRKTRRDARANIGSRGQRAGEQGLRRIPGRPGRGCRKCVAWGADTPLPDQGVLDPCVAAKALPGIDRSQHDAHRRSEAGGRRSRCAHAGFGQVLPGAEFHHLDVATQSWRSRAGTENEGSRDVAQVPAAYRKSLAGSVATLWFGGRAGTNGPEHHPEYLSRDGDASFPTQRSGIHALYRRPVVEDRPRVYGSERLTTLTRLRVSAGPVST